MILIPIVALAVGLLLGTLVSGNLPPAVAPFLSVAVLAGLDSTLGGTRSQMEGKFSPAIFLSGFVFNILFASFLVWLGMNIGVNLVLVAAFVFGARIFQNLSLIRRMIVTKLADRRARAQFEQDSGSQPAQTATSSGSEANLLQS